MNYASHIIDTTQNAAAALFRTVRAVPADRLNWKPEDGARSILEVLQDAAQRSLLFAGVLKGEVQPFTPEFMQQAAQQRAHWTTI